jgi:hypothetical protein
MKFRYEITSCEQNSIYVYESTHKKLEIARRKIVSKFKSRLCGEHYMLSTEKAHDKVQLIFNISNKDHFNILEECVFESTDELYKYYEKSKLSSRKYYHSEKGQDAYLRRIEKERESKERPLSVTRPLVFNGGYHPVDFSKETKRNVNIAGMINVNKESLKREFTLETIFGYLSISILSIVILLICWVVFISAYSLFWGGV